VKIHFIRERRFAYQFEGFGDLFSKGKERLESAVGEATDVAKEVAGDVRDEAVDQATQAAQKTLETVRNLDREKVEQKVGQALGVLSEGLEEFRELSRKLDPGIMQALMMGKEALEEFMSKSENLAKLKSTLEQLVEEGSIKLARQVLDLLMKYDPALRESIQRAELAERAIVGDRVAHLKLAKEGLQQQSGFKQWGYWLTTPWTNGGRNDRVVFERTQIEEKYKEELASIVKAHPFLSENLLRKIIQEGVPDYVLGDQES